LSDGEAARPSSIPALTLILARAVKTTKHTGNKAKPLNAFPAKELRRECVFPQRRFTSLWNNSLLYPAKAINSTTCNKR